MQFGNEQYSPQPRDKNTNKKPQTAERGKSTNKSKDFRPMVFGMKGGR